jgi:hypothetical protein
MAQNLTASMNPRILLAEANCLACLFNWPAAEPLYVRAEELFRGQRDTRDEVYARVGRIRAQSCCRTYCCIRKVIGPLQPSSPPFTNRSLFNML